MSSELPYPAECDINGVLVDADKEVEYRAAFVIG
jgi:hypothetical protein